MPAPIRTDDTPQDRIAKLLPADVTAAFLSAKAALDDHPLPLSVVEWNAAHSLPGNATEFSDRLHFLWHAYATKDRDLSSTDSKQFWRIPQEFDDTNGTVTNYLIRFPLAS